MKLALIQSELVWGNVTENLRRFDEKMEYCRGCDIILLPEMFTSGCMMVKKSREVAVAEKKTVACRFDDVRRKMLEWAGKYTAVIVGSTVYEEKSRYYNRLIIAFPDGRCEYYDKRHCFRMGGENEYFIPGRKRLVFEYKGVKIAAFICYDLRFPVWSRNAEGYDLAVYVANWPASRRNVWQTLLRARAIENQCYVAGVNCVGTDNAGLQYAGDSALIDAKGEIVRSACAGKEEILVADLNLETLITFRKKFAVLDDRDDFELK